jgi:hypothetical protein
MATLKPAASNSATLAASRNLFASNFARQKAAFRFGMVAFAHPGWRCQKHP